MNNQDRPQPINRHIDINCDLGEGETLADCEKDAMLMPYISSCNIACGGHAGNELTIATSLSNAAKYQLKVGAHPGYPDNANFGRISLSISAEKLEQSLKKQIDLISTIATKQQIQLHHIKFHGALYNDIEANNQLAEELAIFCKKYYPSMKLLGLANGNLKAACRKLGINFIAEGFMDRAYLSNGKLTPRNTKGSVFENKSDVIEQALSLACNQTVKTVNQETIDAKVESICLHGDNPNALSIAKSVYLAMSESGVQVK